MRMQSAVGQVNRAKYKTVVVAGLPTSGMLFSLSFNAVILFLFVYLLCRALNQNTVAAYFCCA